MKLKIVTAIDPVPAPDTAPGYVAICPPLVGLIGLGSRRAEAIEDLRARLLRALGTWPDDFCKVPLLGKETTEIDI